MIYGTSWSGQTPDGTWRKTEISLDESDLAIILAESEQTIGKTLHTAMKHKILSTEAQRLILADLLRMFPDSRLSAERAEEVAVLNKRRYDLLNSLKEQ